MDKIKYTRPQINRLHELTEEIRKAEEEASELLRTAQDRHKDRKHKLMREGKEIELTEKVLWDEVFYIGAASEAGKILGKQHPEVFKAYAKQDEAAAELKKFCIQEFGVDYTKMSISDYLKLTEGLYNLLLSESIETGEATQKPWWKRFL